MLTSQLHMWITVLWMSKKVLRRNVSELRSCLEVEELDMAITLVSLFTLKAKRSVLSFKFLLIVKFHNLSQILLHILEQKLKAMVVVQTCYYELGTGSMRSSFFEGKL